MPIKSTYVRDISTVGAGYRADAVSAPARAGSGSATGFVASQGRRNLTVAVDREKGAVSTMSYLALATLTIVLLLLALGLTGVANGTAGVVMLGFLLFLLFTTVALVTPAVRARWSRGH
jgi:uncharacterized membrane protein YtjA (UPF0391 family)